AVRYPSPPTGHSQTRSRPPRPTPGAPAHRVRRRRPSRYAICWTANRAGCVSLLARSIATALMLLRPRGGTRVGRADAVRLLDGVSAIPLDGLLRLVAVPGHRLFIDRVGIDHLRHHCLPIGL